MSNYLITQDQNGNVIAKKPLTGEAITWEEAFPIYKNIKEIGSYGLSRAFYYCSGISSVSFPNLTSIGPFGLYYAFYECSGLTGSVSFPNLTSIGNMGLYKAFYGCLGLTQVHFKASLSGNSQCTTARMGCSNATVYFDL